MSTDRKRLTSAIQRIAREDPEIRELLDDYRNSGGKPSSSATTGSGAEDRQTCCDGSSTGNANPGSSTKDPSEGGADGLDSDDPAKLDNGPGSLAGVKDCATGQPVCFEGSDWIPPDGWDDAQTPPIDEGYEEGFFWEAGSADGLSPDSNCDDLHTEVGLDATHVYSHAAKESDAEYGCWTNRISDGNLERFATSTKKACDGEPVCDEPPPTADAWPEDSCTNLAIKGGKIVGSKFDPENDGSYSKPRGSIELCDDFGNSFELKPSASGGWKTISSQNPGDGYLYDSNGQQIARISGSEFSDPNV